MSPIQNAVGVAGVLADIANTTCANTTSSNTTIFLTTASGNENVVTWQSALWALLALALNAMTQPSVADPTTNSAISLARSSPGICLIDSISTLTWITVGYFYGESVSNSLAAKQMATHDGLTRPRTSTFSPAVSAIFFILGPLPQAIKLAGMSNVFFTNICGFTFFVSYLIGVWESEAVRRATRRHTGEPWLSLAAKAPRIPAHVRDRLAWHFESSCQFMIVYNCVFWVGIAHAIIFTTRDAGELSIRRVVASSKLMGLHSPLLFVALLGGLCGEIYLGKWLRQRFSESVGPQMMRPALLAGLLYGPAALSSFSSLALVIFLFQLLKNSLNSEQEVRLGWKAYADTKESLVVLSGLWGVLLVLTISISLLIVGLFMAGRVLEPRKRHKPKEVEGHKLLYKAFMPGFAACNLIFMVLSYAYIYDETWTSKPAWGEMLG
ncbi:hypothetical protein V490_05852 [Pseudogymnoascus sp. VKM F-3557]|nr:hypothetical protein V490_05852 [Pseudogymnoascus sp. VKM F-3557]